MNQEKQLCTCGKSKNFPYCDHSHHTLEKQLKKTPPTPKKILLMVLPYWTPLIAPQGISCLKAYLQKYGYTVKTVDANLEEKIRAIYDLYFDTLKKEIPASKRGNFSIIGNDVWREHLMAHINHTDKEKYIDLVKILVYQTFFHPIDNPLVFRLQEILEEFCHRLEAYVVHWLEALKPNVLGISVFYDTLPASLYAFRLTRRKYPHIKTVMGGGIFATHFRKGSSDMDFFLEKTKDYIDKVILGEGEMLLLKFLQGELPQNQRLFSREDLDREMVWRFKPEYPDISDFDTGIYFYLAASGARGCSYNCSFCNVKSFFGPYKARPLEQTLEEMRKLSETYGIRLFYMCDSLLNPIITEFSQKLIKDGISLYWDGFLRVVPTGCDLEAIRLWRRAGFYRARIGVESGSQHVLDLMGKKITPQQIKALLTNLADAGIKNTAYFIIGHPGETDEDFQETLDLVEELKDSIWEVRGNIFYYYAGAKGSHDPWHNNRSPLYPQWARDMLISQTWVVNEYPSREIIYRRLNTFVRHCNKLGVPVVNSFKDVNQADERWKKLHENAVPSVLELIKPEGSTEIGKEVNKISMAKEMLQVVGDFEF